MTRLRRKGTQEDWDNIVDYVREQSRPLAAVLERAEFVRAEVAPDYLLVVLEGDRIEAGWVETASAEHSAQTACTQLYGVALRLSWRPRRGPRVNVRERGVA